MLKLFEDGNYYEGQVISGPGTAFDEVKGKMVLCWKVKYVDDDEEEFNLEELKQWGVDNLQIKKRDSGDVPPSAVGDKSIGVANMEQHETEKAVSSTKTNSTLTASIVDESISKNSTDVASTCTASKKVLSPEVAPTIFASVDGSSTVNDSTGEQSAETRYMISSPRENSSQVTLPTNITGPGSTSMDNTFTGCGSKSIAPACVNSEENTSRRIQSVGKKVHGLQFASKNEFGTAKEPPKVDSEGDGKPKSKIEDNSDNGCDEEPYNVAMEGNTKSKPKIEDNLDDDCDEEPSNVDPEGEELSELKNEENPGSEPEKEPFKVDPEGEEKSKPIVEDNTDNDSSPLTTQPRESRKRRRSTGNRGSNERISPEESRIRRRSTRKGSSNDTTSGDAAFMPGTSDRSGRRKSARLTTTEKEMTPMKGNPNLTSGASHLSKPLRDPEVLPKDTNTGRRRSRRGLVAELEQNAFNLGTLKQTDPPAGGRRRRRGDRRSR